MAEPAQSSNAIRVGYARVSTRAQDHAAQLQLLNAADCREIVEETISTRRKDRPKLQATVASLKAGDTLVITKPDRVARSMKELLIFLEDELAPRGINLHILTGICAGTHKPNGQSIADKMLFMVAAMAAEMERDLIQERTNEGLDAARALGRVGGRPAAVTDDVLAAARARRARGQSVTAIARALGVGRSTLYRALEDDEPAAEPEPAEPVEADVDPVPASAAPLPLLEVPGASVEQADASPAAVDQPSAAAEEVPWTSEADPVKRRTWYTDDELNAVQVVRNDRGGYWVIVAGDLLGMVEPHRTARGGRSGWEARHRGGSAAWHLGTGVKGAGTRPATRDAAVIDLIAAVQHAWKHYRERKKRDATLRRLEEDDRP